MIDLATATALQEAQEDLGDLLLEVFATQRLHDGQPSRTGGSQQGRGIDPKRRELVGERPQRWSRTRPVTICEHFGMVVEGNQWAFRQHQQTRRCQKAQRAA